jgi:hypothetical protein
MPHAHRAPFIGPMLGAMALTLALAAAGPAAVALRFTWRFEGFAFGTMRPR